MDTFLLVAAIVAVGIVAVYLIVSIRLERFRRRGKGGLMKTTYTEGPDARKTFDEGMTKPFPTPKITAQNPKT
jgi:hypothetical protein